MIRGIIWAGKAICAGIVAILVLSAFCLVYNYSGAHIDNASSSTDYKWQPNDLRVTMGEGFSWLRMDAMGFNNQWNPHRDSVDVLLMGSSHEEAVNVGVAQSTAYVLNSLLQSSDSYCYSIAMSGHTICHNVKNLAAAMYEYRPSNCVVIETSTIHPSEAAMVSVICGTFPKIVSYDSGVLFHLQKIPALKAIYKSFERLVLLGSVAETDDDDSFLENESPTYEAVLKTFLEKAKKDVGDTRLIIVYHPTMKINRDGTVAPSMNVKEAAAFFKLCSDTGIEFIDMTDMFLAQYNEFYELPHGFSNTHVGFGHLNAIGHKLIANAIYQALTTKEVCE